MIIKHKTNDEKGYEINFYHGVRVDVTGEGVFDIEFIDNDTDELIYKSSITKGKYSKPNIEYYKNWKVNITNNGITKTEYLELEGKEVLIELGNTSKALGDSVSWMPYAEEFRKKHNCIVYCKTSWVDLYKNSYPEINFISEIGDLETYASYLIVWYTEYHKSITPHNHIDSPLQKLASDILGLEYKEIRPKIDIEDSKRPIKEKYVCLSHHSTTNSKYWHYPYINSVKGWQKLVDWLNFIGYKIIVISKEKTNLRNVVDMTGDYPIKDRVNQIFHSEFFIGVSSGLSWLAWAIGKRVILISGFTHPHFEFTENIIRVYNDRVCNGCFNKFPFDKSDWNWCPEHKGTERQFECTRNITPKMIADEITENQLVENKYYNFDVKIEDTKIPKNLIHTSYIDYENKLIINYIGKNNINGINIDVIDDKNEILYTILNTTLTNKFNNWTQLRKPEKYGLVSDKTKKLKIRFYKDKILLEIILNFEKSKN